MRKIEFKGIRKDNNEVVYGDLLQPTEICDIYEISDKNSIDGSRYEVYKDSICQYTGLDKNNEKVFENDIFKCEGYYDNDTYIEPHICIVKWNEDEACFSIYNYLNLNYETDLFNFIHNIKAIRLE